tara:strand:+ start:395 stop:637 length:243 start_codon:yes stop_codon:yes gene_type:complete
LQASAANTERQNVIGKGTMKERAMIRSNNLLCIFEAILTKLNLAAIPEGKPAKNEPNQKWLDSLRKARQIWKCEKPPKED